MGRKLERLVPVYHKANVLGLQTFLRDKFAIWARNGRCVEAVCNTFKNAILESIERCIPHKIRRKMWSLNTTIKKWESES
jgi:hypothetical protein